MPLIPAVFRDQPDGLSTDVFDVLVIGLGINGIYQLHKLRSSGLQVVGVDSGGVGGTWYWNRYPGARFDSESYLYGYFASERLYKAWRWSERFAGQPEIEAYLNAAVAEFDLGDVIRPNTRVTAMDFDGALGVWNVQTSVATLRARFVVTALGMLSHPIYPDIPGRHLFSGHSYHTGQWPENAVDLAGRRIGLIGTGSSGVQLATAVAHEVAELTIFQRTPNWCTPLRNSPLSDEDHDRIWASFEDFHDKAMDSMTGFIEEFVEAPGDYLLHSPVQRRAVFERAWRVPGFAKYFANYPEVLAQGEINREYCAFIAEQIRRRVHDPKLADKLIPDDHLYGEKRPPFEDGYYEIFNLPQVSLIDGRETPIEAIMAEGVRTSETTHQLDVLVYATGFVAFTGSYEAIRISAYGRTLKEAWADGPRTYLGIQTPGFPNLFHVAGPQAAIRGNVPRTAEPICDFVTDLVSAGIRRSVSFVDTSQACADAWTEEVEASAGGIRSQRRDWRTGANVPGRRPSALVHLGGLRYYRRLLDEIRAEGFRGFEFARR